MADAASNEQARTASHTTEEQKYLLSRDYAASARLNFQHYIWKSELGFNLHPSIKISENAQIADVAAGTAIWATEVAHELPSVHIDCLDISLKQTPPQVWLPTHIQLHEWDMFDPRGPPAGLEGKFDIVHIRLVVLAFEDDVTPLINNLNKLLKPNGYLQWDENDFRDHVHMHPTITDPNILARDAPALSRVLALMAERGNKDWAIRLPEVLEEHGFTSAQAHNYRVNKTMLKWNMDLLLMVWDEIVDQMPSSMAERKMQFNQLVQGMKSEAAMGHVMATGKTVVVAQKQK